MHLSDLGVIYEKGNSLPQDFALAGMWYILAAANGDGDAAMLRDHLAEKMSPDQIAEAQCMAREWKPPPAQ